MDEPSCLEASNCLFLGMNDRKRHKYPFFWSTWSQFWGKMTAFEAVLGCVMVNNIPRKWQPKLAIWPFLAVFGGKPNLWMALEGRNTNIGPNPLGYTSVTSMTMCRNIKLKIFGRTLCIAWLASVHSGPFGGVRLYIGYRAHLVAIFWPIFISTVLYSTVYTKIIRNIQFSNNFYL